MKEPKKSILRDYMRDSYEEFGRLLADQIMRSNPKKHKMAEEVKKAIQKLIDDEFGKDKGGSALFD